MHKHRPGKKKHPHHHGHATGHGGGRRHGGHRGCHHGRLGLSGPWEEGGRVSRLRQKADGRPGAGAVPKVVSHRCRACGKCQRACPSSAIHVAPEVARIDAERCTGCGACVAACPAGALSF